MRLRYTETALSEIEGIFLYLSERNPGAAKVLANRLKDVASLLKDYPLFGRESDEPGVRIASLVRFPFLIFYTISGDEVVILNVRHAARAWPWEG
jgi:plasmid stabilization system protein ParE